MRVEVNGRVGGALKKPSKDEISIIHEISIISALTRPNNSLKDATNVRFSYWHPKLFGFTVERAHREGVGWEGGTNPHPEGCFLRAQGRWNGIYFLLLSELLKYQNSRITCPLQKKLGPVMYHLNTFQYQKNEGDNQGGGGAGKTGGCMQKAMKKCHEFNKISTFT